MLDHHPTPLEYPDVSVATREALIMAIGCHDGDKVSASDLAEFQERYDNAEPLYFGDEQFHRHPERCPQVKRSHVLNTSFASGKTATQDYILILELTSKQIARLRATLTPTDQGLPHELAVSTADLSFYRPQDFEALARHEEAKFLTTALRQALSRTRTLSPLEQIELVEEAVKATPGLAGIYDAKQDFGRLNQIVATDLAAQPINEIANPLRRGLGNL